MSEGTGRGLHIGVGVIAFLALAAVIWAVWDSEAEDPRGLGSGTQAEGGEAVGGDGVVGPDGVRVSARGDRAFDGDAGVRRPQGSRNQVSRSPLKGAQPALARRQNLSDLADRSAGYRLGHTRRRAQVLEDRLTRLDEAIAQLREQGNDALVARQQAIIDRTRQRLTEIREEETELASAAEAEGSMGDVEEGFESGPIGAGSPGESGGAPATATLPR